MQVFLYVFFVTGEKVNNGIEQNTDLLTAYLKEPLESTVLVFFAPYEKLDERKKVTKQLKKLSYHEQMRITSLSLFPLAHEDEKLDASDR